MTLTCFDSSLILVFQIMLEFYCTKSWSEALEKSMPSRKGFVLADEKQEENKDNNEENENEK